MIKADTLCVGFFVIIIQTQPLIYLNKKQQEGEMNGLQIRQSISFAPHE
jgi:hypothetical protein